MDVLHITPTKNIKKIMTSKIFRRRPLLEVYDDVMESYYGSDYDFSKGLVFGFPETISNRDKCIKDFIYWKTWGDDRNKWLDKYSYDEFTEAKNDGINIFSHIVPKAEHFSILLLDIEHEPLFNYYKHQQDSDMGPFWVDMDVRYEHNDKPLTLINYDVEVNRIKKIIGTAESFITKKNKIDISLHI